MRQLLLISLFITSSILHAQFEENFTPQTEKGKLSVKEFMAQERTPAFSFYAVLGNGRDTSVLLGHRGDESQSPIQLNTRFQAGAMSGAPVCMAILHLVGKGIIHLDSAANIYLPFPIADERKNPDGPITVRDLLTYNRDFKMDQKPKGLEQGSPLPSLVEILKGNGNAKNKPISVKGNINDEDRSQYGNVLYLQLMLEHHFKKPLASIIQELILDPIGMEDTRYLLELDEEDLAVSAVGHDGKGKAIAGGYLRYPETATAGMWTTPRDYCKLVQHVMNAAKGIDNSILTVELAKAGLTKQARHRSLIFNINGYGNAYWGGNCKGYYMSMQAWPEKGIVAVGASNNDLQWRLVNPSLWQTYKWAEEHIGKNE